MGLLVKGHWQSDWYNTQATDGRFVREVASFRNWITTTGEAGPSGNGGFAAAAGRYHLYISLACPWAHRTLLFLKLKDLESMISVSVVNAFMGEEGWTFRPGDGVIADNINHKEKLHEIYTLSEPSYTGRVTVPVLWDKKTGTIVNNESAEIIRMFNSAFDHLGANPVDYYPEHLREDIDALNEQVYHAVNNGVYKAGFATTQSAYEEALTALFTMLEQLEARLGQQRYLLDTQITEADWRLFTTLIRFDAVYVGHFKCNLKRIADYPALSGYLRDLYQVPGIAETVNMHYIKSHYYGSHETINPTRIIPSGPVLDFTRPHRRENIGK